MKFKDVPQFPRAHWAVNVGWSFLEDHIRSHEEMGLDLEPDFQRAHVWTEAQRTAYIEHVLQGGEVGRELTFNAIGWSTTIVPGSYVIVDGKQRLNAVREFMAGHVKAFGQYYPEFGDRPSFTRVDFVWRVCELATRADVLRLYLSINAGGTPHTADEIARVKALLEQEIRR